MSCSCLRRAFLVAAATAWLATGCASTANISTADATGPSWQGRLSVRIEGAAPQSMTAAFELNGSIDQGALLLVSPLGTTLASARWSSEGVIWQAAAEKMAFENLDALAVRLTGTTLPFAALMDWLRGVPTVAGGWQVDLNDYASGRIQAHRDDPQAPAFLRIALDR